MGFVFGANHAEVECAVKSIEEVGDMIDEDEKLVGRMSAVLLDDSTDDEGDTPKADKKK